jgi:helicase MOV-10
MAPNPYPRLCTALLVPDGSCNNDACSMDHDFKFCVPCGRPFVPEAAYHGHLSGKDHFMATNSYWLVCTVCAISTTRPAWDAHIRSSGHVKNSSRRGVPADHPPENATTLSGYKQCDVCRRLMPGTAWDNHLGGKVHARRQRLAAYLVKIEQAEKARQGITISHRDGVDFGVVDPLSNEAIAEMIIDIDIATDAIGVKYITTKITKGTSARGSKE